MDKPQSRPNRSLLNTKMCFGYFDGLGKALVAYNKAPTKEGRKHKEKTESRPILPIFYLKESNL